MACQGGCIGGSGQPIGSTLKVKERRIEQIYTTDKCKSVRKSYGNPAIIGLYREYLGEPLRYLSHKLIHTTYSARKSK